MTNLFKDVGLLCYTDMSRSIESQEKIVEMALHLLFAMFIANEEILSLPLYYQDLGGTSMLVGKGRGQLNTFFFNPIAYLLSFFWPSSSSARPSAAWILQASFPLNPLSHSLCYRSCDFSDHSCILLHFSQRPPSSSQFIFLTIYWALLIQGPLNLKFDNASHFSMSFSFSLFIFLHIQLVTES